MPDLKVSTDGDFVLEKGTLALTADIPEALQQELLFRLQTDLMDYQPQPNLGIGLHQFIGLPNTGQVTDQIQQAIVRALTRDDKFPSVTLQVEVVPISIDKVAIFIFHVPRTSSNAGSVAVEVVLDLIAGTITPITG